MTEPVAEYRVELDAFSGPLDLLLYLIRREELDILDIPVARVTEHYLRYVDLLSELNINVAGEFIVMAATLIEIKSRMMTPEPEAMPEEEAGDPRMELVRQLMAYRQFKEAALALTEQAEAQGARFARPGERPDGVPDHSKAGPAGISLWTLLDAFNKVLDQTGARQPHRLVLDTIPQEQIKAELEERVRLAGRISFYKVFEGQVTRTRIVGTFLGMLELMKLQVLRVEQEEAFGEIWISYVLPEERETIDDPTTAGTPATAAAEEAGEPQPSPEEELPLDEDWKLPEVPDIGPEAAPAPLSEPAPAGKPAPDNDEDEFDDEEDEFDDDDDDDDDDEDE